MPVQLVKMQEVLRRAAISKSSLYECVTAGTFPKPIKRGSTPLWLESELEAMVLAYAREAGAGELMTLSADLVAKRAAEPEEEAA